MTHALHDCVRAELHKSIGLSLSTVYSMSLYFVVVFELVLLVLNFKFVVITIYLFQFFKAYDWYRGHK